jgi:hypothetical protein
MYYQIIGSSEMTRAEPSIKREEPFEFFQDYWYHDWIICHPTLYCKEKKPKMMQMRSDAVIFVKFVAQLLKSVGGYFIWSAGP